MRSGWSASRRFAGRGNEAGEIVADLPNMIMTLSLAKPCSWAAAATHARSSRRAGAPPGQVKFDTRSMRYGLAAFDREGSSSRRFRRYVDFAVSQGASRPSSAGGPRLHGSQLARYVSRCVGLEMVARATSLAGPPTASIGEVILGGFAVAVSFLEGEVVLSVRGEVDLVSAPELRSVLGEMIDLGHRVVAIDLAELSFMAVAGLGVIATEAGRLGSMGGTLFIRSPPALVRKLLDITGLTTIVRVEDLEQPRSCLLPE
jgi:anti-sigma B factor antagonist